MNELEICIVALTMLVVCNLMLIGWLNRRIKQLDNFRRQGLDQAIEGFRTGDLKLFTSGFTRLVHLAGLFYLMGVGADALKDLFRRRTFYLNDAAIENLYKLFGFYRFNVEQSLQKGDITDVFWNSIKPVIPIFPEIGRDIKTLTSSTDNLFKFFVENYEKFRTPELIPIIGNYWSNRFGRGAFLEFKKQEQKQKEAEIKAGIRPDPELIEEQKEAGMKGRGRQGHGGGGGEIRLGSAKRDPNRL